MRHALMALLLFAGSANADSLIRVPAHVTGEGGSFVIIQAETNCKEVRWVALDPGMKVFPYQLLKDQKNCVVFAPIPGTYRLLAYTAAGDMPSDPQICTVEFTGIAPTPPGPSPPTPPTPPAPVVAKKAWVVIVEETADRTGATAAIIGDLDFWDSMAKLGHRRRVYDKDKPVVKDNGYAKIIADNNLPLPAMLILSEDGKQLKSMKLPATVAGVREAIKEATGT